MPGEFLLPLAFGEIAAHPGGERQALDEERDVAVVEPDVPPARRVAGEVLVMSINRLSWILPFHV